MQEVSGSIPLGSTNQNLDIIDCWRSGTGQMDGEKSTSAGSRWYHPQAVAKSIALRPRVYLAALAGVSVFFLLPRSLSASVREALAWIAAGSLYLGFAVQLMIDGSSHKMAARAARSDESRMVILALILLAIGSSFFSIAGLMTEAKEATRNIKLLFLALAALTIIVSWTVTQFLFALHYAHEFYRPTDDGQTGGLDFPHEQQPDYWDFVYFSTSIGATSQTSDVSIRSRAIRRLVTVHAVVSFFFNSAVLALTINLAASVI
jgi:uncharacterized membrane protein